MGLMPLSQADTLAARLGYAPRDRALLVVALRGAHRWLATVTGLVLLIEVLQGVLGWVQYSLDLPVGLVALHMLGAALLAAGLARIGLAVLPHTTENQALAGGESQPHAATRLP
jgi:cytochrome c oxidase assembly protein subunit 15